MAGRKKHTQKKSASGRTGCLRIGCLTLVVVLAVGISVFLTRPSAYKQRLLQYITERYPHIREIGKPLSPQGTVYVTLCFGDENSDYLIKENRQIEAPATPAGKATALIQELIAGPRAKGTATMPQGVKLRGIKIEDDMLVVDFSQELVTRHPGGSTSEMMTVFSLVNTITMNIPEIKKVKFLVEGKPIETIAGHIDCSEPIQPQFGLVH